MKLVWSDLADSNAADFIAKIIEAAEGLEAFPELGRRVPEAGRDPDVRELLFRNRRIIYRLERKRDRVLILGVVHGRQDLARALRKPWEVH